MVSLVVGLLGMVGLLVVHQEGMDQGWSALEGDFLTQAQLDRLKADQRAIAETGIFPEQSRKRDAGEILNPFTRLDGGTVEQQTAVAPQWWDGWEVFQQTRGARGKDRPKPDARPWLVAPESMPQGDLSFLAELLAYDHWETGSPGGRYAEYLQSGEFPYLASSPIPNFVFLQTLARLRLAQGLASGDRDEMLRALTETRHLARLIHSTECLVSSMVAVAVVGIENRGYDQAVARGILAAADWQPVSDEVRHGMRRAGFGMVQVQMGWTVPEDALAQVEALGVPLFGLCSGLSEAVFMHHMQYPVWKGIFGERDLSEEGAAVKARLDRSSSCRLDVARDVMAHPERMTHALWEQSASTPGLYDKDDMIDFDRMKIPYLRGISMLETMHQTGLVRMYRQYGETAEEDWAGVKPRP